MSVKLKKLTFNNMFSYGDKNTIDLAANSITQLVAVNGTGKTSLSLIIQELLYNKNIKGLKKAEILNRYTNAKTWSGSLEFEVNGANYTIHSNRTGATSNITLYKDGVNISDHKVLDTYKKVQDIIGCDFTVFSQLTYQSSTDSLEFLKATDTNRKKFLINLFGLEKYLEIGDSLKLRLPQEETKLAKKQGELKTVEDVLTNIAIPEILELKKVPEIDNTLKSSIDALKLEILSHKEYCSKIDKNNLLIQERNELIFDIALEQPNIDDNYYDTLNSAKKDEIRIETDIKTVNKQIKELDVADECYVCHQPIDNTTSKLLLIELNSKLKTLQTVIADKRDTINTLEKHIKEYEKKLKSYNINKKNIERFEQLSQLIDSELPINYPNYDNLISKLKGLELEYATLSKEREEVIKYNDSIKVRNAKIDLLREQKIEFSARQQLLKDDIIVIQDKVVSLQMLKKAFSTNGIVAYKLENVTKQLENSINNYLATLSDGQFQVIFRLDSDKLNVIIINNGKEVSIESLSGGEFSRVQTSVLLAVRKTLSQIGNNHINLLFLDEITGVLDESGKEKLFDILQDETDLNVFIISHEYSHPLIPKVEILKENNISYINN